MMSYGVGQEPRRREIRQIMMRRSGKYFCYNNNCFFGPAIQKISLFLASLFGYL